MAGIKYAKVLLNLAEAEARTGNQIRARAMPEAIRHRLYPCYNLGTLNLPIQSLGAGTIITLLTQDIYSQFRLMGLIIIRFIKLNKKGW